MLLDTNWLIDQMYTATYLTEGDSEQYITNGQIFYIYTIHKHILCVCVCAWVCLDHNWSQNFCC